MLRLLVAVLACAPFVYAVDPEEHIRKSVPVSSATRLVFRADRGGIRLEPGNEKTVDVDVYFQGVPRRDYRLDISQQGAEIRATGEFRDGWQPWFIDWLFDGLGPHKLEYRVAVPRGFNADVETSGGPIFVSNLDGQVRVHTSGGPIRVEDVGGDMDVSTSGGPISIQHNSGRVRAHTSGGAIEIREARGAVDASTSGGPVDASLVAQPKDDCRLTTSGGAITVTLKRNIHVDLDASTSGGRVWTDFPVTISGDRHSSELRTSINGGGPRLYLHTSGGGIQVRQGD